MKPIETMDVISATEAVITNVPQCTDDILYSFDFWAAKHDIEYVFNRLYEIKKKIPQNPILNDIMDVCRLTYDDIYTIIDHCSKDVILRKKRIVDQEYKPFEDAGITFDQYIASKTNKVVKYMGVEYYEMA